MILNARPSEGGAIAGPLFKRFAVRRDRLLQPHRIILSFPKRRQRVAKVVLGSRPLKRDAFARLLRECGAVGSDCMPKALRPSLPLSKLPERVAEVALYRRPVEWCSISVYIAQSKFVQAD
jgi:hypothetical protein